MRSGLISRKRLAGILALAVMLWSNAALAAFVCPHMTGCHHTAANPDQSSDGAEEASSAADSQASSRPCCPADRELTMQCAAPDPDCCVFQQQRSQTTAIVYKYDQVRPSPSATIATDAAAMVTAQPFALASSTPSVYIKPISQKKTDLRI